MAYKPNSLTSGLKVCKLLLKKNKKTKTSCHIFRNRTNIHDFFFSKTENILFNLMSSSKTNGNLCKRLVSKIFGKVDK